jgi:hypothetical protein
LTTDVRGGGTIKGITFNSFCTLTLPAGKPYLLKVALLYNDTPQPIALKASVSIPNQGYCYEATASVTESGVSRKIIQCKSWPDISEVFSWGLFSGQGNLEQSL